MWSHPPPEPTCSIIWWYLQLKKKKLIQPDDCKTKLHCSPFLGKTHFQQDETGTGLFSFWMIMIHDGDGDDADDDYHSDIYIYIYLVCSWSSIMTILRMIRMLPAPSNQSV